jgi:hypothetical protein
LKILTLIPIASIIKTSLISKHSFLNSLSISFFKYNKIFQWNTVVKALAFSLVYTRYKQYRYLTILACVLRASYLVLKKIIVLGIFWGVTVQPSKFSLLMTS